MLVSSRSMWGGNRQNGADDVVGVVMSSGHQPSWTRLLWWLVVAIVGLQLLASVLPRLLPALVVLAAVIAVLRLVWFYTSR